MRTKTALAVLLASCIAVPAAAVEVTGVTLTFEHREPNYDFENPQQHFTGDIELSFGAGFSTQLGIKNTNYDGPGDAFGSRGHELHLIWRPEQVAGLAVGAFYGEEFFDPWYTYHGIEAQYEVSGVSVEAAVLDYSGEGYDARHLTLEVGYAINDRFAVFAGHSDLSTDDSSFTATNTYLGGSVAVAQGFSFYGTYGSNRYDDSTDDFEIVTLGVRYDFGQGVTFGQRGYSDLLPND